MSSNGISNSQLTLYLKENGIYHYEDIIKKLLLGLQIHVVLDDSGSTENPINPEAEPKDRVSIYKTMGDKLKSFFYFSTLLDNDGISISFLNNSTKIYNIKDVAELDRLLNENKPNNEKQTPLLGAFNNIIKYYKTREGKPLAISIWTDGVPSDCNDDINNFTSTIKSELMKNKNMSVNLVVFTKDTEINDFYQNIDDGKTPRFNTLSHPDFEEVRVNKANKLKGTFTKGTYMLMATLGAHCKTIGDLNNVDSNVSTKNIIFLLCPILVCICSIIYYLLLIQDIPTLLNYSERLYVDTYDLFSIHLDERSFQIFIAVVLVFFTYFTCISLRYFFRAIFMILYYLQLISMLAFIAGIFYFCYNYSDYIIYFISVFIYKFFK